MQSIIIISSQSVVLIADQIDCYCNYLGAYKKIVLQNACSFESYATGTVWFEAKYCQYFIYLYNSYIIVHTNCLQSRISNSPLHTPVVTTIINEKALCTWQRSVKNLKHVYCQDLQLRLHVMIII